MTKSSPQWRYLELVSAFGPDADVAEVIRAAGYQPPPIRTIAGWRARNSIPPAWAPILIQAALDRGILSSIPQLKRVEP